MISFSRKDDGLAARLKGQSGELGLKVFGDADEIETGAAFPGSISKAIGSAGSVIGLWSKSSFESDWCRREWTLAQSLNRLLKNARILSVAEALIP